MGPQQGKPVAGYEYREPAASGPWIMQRRGQTDAVLHVIHREGEERELALAWEEGGICRLLGHSDHRRGELGRAIRVRIAEGPRMPQEIAEFMDKDANVVQAIANTAGFHFAFIEQGGTSLYPSLAQRVSNPEVLRVLLSIGPSETMHFQVWHDKAGNAPNVSVTIDGQRLSFPNLNIGEATRANLIMPEPTVFLNSRPFPPVSIIRPTDTEGVATGAVQSLVDDGLFRDASPGLVPYLRELAAAADAAQRGY